MNKAPAQTPAIRLIWRGVENVLAPKAVRAADCRHASAHVRAHGQMRRDALHLGPVDLGDFDQAEFDVVGFGNRHFRLSDWSVCFPPSTTRKNKSGARETSLP